MSYGRFDDQQREYVITRRDTPLPWINYLGHQDFLALISNTAGGYAFYQDARLRRLTRYRYNNVPLDTGSRFVYLRDDDVSQGDAPLIWSPTGAPVRARLDAYECRHGFGYTRITSQLAGIECRSLFLVPLEETLELWQLSVTNHREEAAQLSLFAAVEFCLWDAWDDATNFQRNLSLAEVEVDPGVIYHKTEYRERRNHFASFACSEPTEGFDTQRSAFLGAGRGWDRPQAVETGRMTYSVAHGWAPIGAHHVRLDLAPGETRGIVFSLAYHENPADAKFAPPDSLNLNKATAQATLQRYLRPDAVTEAMESLGVHWSDLLGGLQVTTPDKHTDRMVNLWNAYQNVVTFNVSRSASYFESGVGRGIGFRDTCQDLLGSVHMIPARARIRLLDLAATQLPDGGAYHQFQPLTKRGNNDIGSGFNDDPLWLILASAGYLKETGDDSILDHPVPFDNQPGSEAPFYEHLRRSVGYTLDRLGPHGLPLIGRADWNDCLNLNAHSVTPGQSFQTLANQPGEVAESVFIAGLFLLAVDELIAIARRSSREDDAAAWEQAADRMRDAIDESGWDGEWFLRAYDSAGEPIGTHASAQGQIFIEPQGMCVMAGLGLENGRARMAMDSVAGRLATSDGIVLLDPAYCGYDPRLGEITTYPPGYKENGAVFCQTNPWIMIAETHLGRGDVAHDYYLRINPSARQAQAEVHRCEPYVYAQMIAGREAATPGEAKNSWLTATAAWNYVAITQWILGIRPSYDGLIVAPVLPADWDGFQAVRRFRGATYTIRVEKLGPGNDVRLEIDGRPLEGQTVPIAPAGSTVDVVAVVGGSQEPG
jgi:cellobiose phosphorylase